MSKKLYIVLVALLNGILLGGCNSGGDNSKTDDMSYANYLVTSVYSHYYVNIDKEQTTLSAIAYFSESKDYNPLQKDSKAISLKNGVNVSLSFSELNQDINSSFLQMELNKSVCDNISCYVDQKSINPDELVKITNGLTWFKLATNSYFSYFPVNLNGSEIMEVKAADDNKLEINLNGVLFQDDNSQASLIITRGSGHNINGGTWSIAKQDCIYNSCRVDGLDKMGLINGDKVQIMINNTMVNDNVKATVNYSYHSKQITF